MGSMNTPGLRNLGYGYKIFGLGGGRGSGPMDPTGQDPGRPIQPTDQPDRPDPTWGPVVTPDPNSEDTKARMDRIAEEQKRIKDMDEADRNAFMRSAWNQHPSEKSAADYLRATGVDPTVFLRTDQTIKNRANEQYGLAGMFRPTYDQSKEQASRANQLGLAGMLQERASGQKSAVAEMLRIQGERNAQQAFANARANSAYNPGLSQMLAEQAAAQSRAQAAEQGSIAALQEQEQAQNILGGLYGQMRSQDLQSLGMGTDVQMQAEQMRRQGQLAALGMQSDLSEADRQALIAREQLVNRFALAQDEINAANKRAAADRYWGLGAGIASGVARGLVSSYFGGGGQQQR